MDENVIGQIRRGMQGASIPVEFTKGEAWYGQHELNMRYACAVTSADRHTIYKNGVKEIAFLNGVSATVMAKPSEKDIGSSCHIHSSLLDAQSGASAFVDGHQETDIFAHYLGGMRADPRAGAVHRTGGQLLQALRHRELGADLDLGGAATTAPAASGSSATGSRGWSAGSPAPTSTPTSGTRRCSPPASMGSSRAPTRGPSWSARRTLRRRPSRARPRCAMRSTCGRQASSLAGCSARMCGVTT
jgi:hypothetical protein